ncbi:hypothetical protein Pelo_16998 [Pelomyxa schiedti]|nr:hypothetical protein Pelo_16998 [Pelomyxa schiedti]
MKPVSSWTIDEVTAWLKEKGFAEFCPHFVENKINGSGLLVLLRSDLEHILGPGLVTKTIKLYSLIIELRGAYQEAKFPTANTDFPNSQVVYLSPFLIFTSKLFIQLGLIRIGFTDPFFPHLIVQVVIALIGDTGSGKSHLTNEFLPFVSRRDHKGPIIASHNQQQPTTGNIHLFRGELSTAQQVISVLLMDVEGEKGGIPKAMQGVVQNFMTRLFTRLSQMLPDANSAQAEVDKLLEKRMEAVRQQFPQIVYALSDVVMYISRDAIQNKGYTERVLRFASCMANQDVVGHKPHLILIQNFCPDVRPKYTEWDIKKSTEDFNTRDSSTCEVWKALNKCFSSVTFVRLPNAFEKPKFYEYVIENLKSHLANIFSNQLSALRVSKLFTERMHKNKLMLEPSSHICAIKLKKEEKQKCTPPLFDAVLIISKFRSVLIERTALHLIPALRELNITTAHDLDNPTAQRAIQDSFCCDLKTVLSMYQPCEFKANNAVCIHTLANHKDGHRLMSVGILITVSQQTGDFICEEKDFDISTELISKMKKYIQIPKEDTISLCYALALKFFESEFVKPERCVLCLHEPLSPVLECSERHTWVCSSCIERLPRKVWNLNKLPARAQPRVLSLDGGGGVRGIVQVVMLQHIMQQMNLTVRIYAFSPLKVANLPHYEQKLSQLFDLVGGVGTGGITALALGSGIVDIDTLFQFYSVDYPGFYTKSYKVAKFIGMYFNNWYDRTGLDTALLKMFGDASMHGNPDGCKIFVIGRPDKAGQLVLFTTYHVSIPEKIEFVED